MTYNLTTLPAPRRFTARRIALAIAALVAFPLILAMIAGTAIGIRDAASADSHRGPNAAEMKILNQANADSATPCWAEWNEIQAGFEIICAPGN